MRLRRRTAASRAFGARRPAESARRAAGLTRRGWWLLGVGAATLALSYPLGRQELVYLGVFLLLMPLCAFAFIRLQRPRLSVTRRFSPPTVGAGQPAVAEVTLANPSSRRTLEANWRDSWPWYPFATTPVRLPTLAAAPRPDTPGAALTVRYLFQPRLRGVFTVGPILLEYTDPFALARGASPVGGATPLTVTPVVVTLADDLVLLAAEEGANTLRQRRASGGEDDLLPREYRRGDALRRVHWRASAHHGELMVRQEEQRSHAEARLLVDTRRSHYRDATRGGSADRAESGSFELAVELVASLGLHLLRSGFQVELVETGEPQIATLDRPAEFINSLASVRLVDGEAEGFSLARGRPRPDRARGTMFAIISDADPQLVERLALQGRSFALAVAFVISPRPGEPVPGESVQSLRDAGWLCVTARPGDSVDQIWRSVGVEQGANRARS